MKHLFTLFLVAILSLGCETRDSIVSFDPSLSIEFSSDSIIFDTLLSNFQSPTQRLTVFNPNNRAIQLSEIVLAKDEQSEYSVIINGRPTNQIVGEQILAGDSIQILINTKIDPRNQDLPYLVKDSVVFRWNGNEDHVKLISWGQDGRRKSTQIICDELWTNERPYIVEDTLIVDSACTLTIQKGTTVYFENNAALFIRGSLIAEGDSAEHIIFRSSRFDGFYNSTPGQWNGIYFLEGSSGNEISFTEIFNGQIGLRVGTPDHDTIPDVIVRNSIIHTMGFAGILGFTSDILAINTLVYNCGTYLIGGFAGGNYSFKHCTFSNESSFFIHSDPSVQFSDNLVLSQTETLIEELSIVLENSILWGSSREELVINDGGGTSPRILLNQNIIRSLNNWPNSITSIENNYPGFVSPFAFDFNLDTLSNAKDIGAMIGIEDDITGSLRDSLPDIGSYERFE